MNLTKFGLLLCIVLAAPGTVHAGVIAGESSAEFLDLGLSLDALAGIVDADASVGIPVLASGTSPGMYNNTTGLASVNTSAGVVKAVDTEFLGLPVTGVTLATLARVNTGLITSNAQSDVDGLMNSGLASGTHTIDDLNLTIVDLLGVSNLISITADSLVVKSLVTGEFGALTATGTLDVVNLVISVAGNQVYAQANGSIGPNFGIDIAAGLDLLGVNAAATLVLNKQEETGDAFNNLALKTTAISLVLKDIGVSGLLLDLGTLNGNVTLGETYASLNAQASPVPEPSSLALLGVGSCFAAVCAVRRRRREQPLATA